MTDSSSQWCNHERLDLRVPPVAKKNAGKKRLRKLWTTIYTPKMARTALRLWQNAFQTIPNISFFNSRFFLSRTFDDFHQFFQVLALFWRATHFWASLASAPWKTIPCRPNIIPVRCKKWFVVLCQSLEYFLSPFFGPQAAVHALCSGCDDAFHNRFVFYITTDSCLARFGCAAKCSAGGRVLN